MGAKERARACDTRSEMHRKNQSPNLGSVSSPKLQLFRRFPSRRDAGWAMFSGQRSAEAWRGANLSALGWRTGGAP